ncbi:hypothetical protein RND81_03G230200 [Saponaria officinalis]|uniref:Reverse transcriptase n=1 Tax=Saponaria officinalis TaxID=3572 RepID=A0AAW1MAT6_SAPOF
MMLSRAGRGVLIKAIAQSIPTYAMSVFKLPANFCSELRSLVSGFWWGSKEGKRKIPWVSWAELCKPKALGGFGFRDFQDFNKALLGKQAWRLVTNRNCLMLRVLLGKYCPGGAYMRAELGSNPSYSWHGIWEAREVLLRGIRRRVGNGFSTRIWGDPWIPKTQSR